MIDVLLLCVQDNANTGWKIFKCLQSLGLKVMGFKGEFHPFAYPEQLPIHPYLRMASEMDGAAFHFNIPDFEGYFQESRVIHYMHSYFIGVKRPLDKKRVVVQHGGAFYRVNPEMHNTLFNPIADATIIQMPDLWNLGAEKKHLIYFPVQTDTLMPNYRRANPDKIVIGHFPSRSTWKGSDVIGSVLDRLKAEPKYADAFEYVGFRTDQDIKDNWSIWYNQIQKYRDCDIIIDNLSSIAQDREYGEWGNTAFEASALGKIVVTASIHHDLYEQEYGECALQIANDEKAFEKTIRNLLSMGPAELVDLKQKARTWVVEKHSIEATANRLWERIYKYFF